MGQENSKNKGLIIDLIAVLVIAVFLAAIFVSKNNTDDNQPAKPAEDPNQKGDLQET